MRPRGFPWTDPALWAAGSCASATFTTRSAALGAGTDRSRGLLLLRPLRFLSRCAQLAPEHHNPARAMADRAAQRALARSAKGAPTSPQAGIARAFSLASVRRAACSRGVTHTSRPDRGGAPARSARRRIDCTGRFGLAPARRAGSGELTAPASPALRDLARRVFRRRVISSGLCASVPLWQMPSPRPPQSPAVQRLTAGRPSSALHPARFECHRKNVPMPDALPHAPAATDDYSESIAGAPLESILCTDELDRRPSRGG